MFYQLGTVCHGAQECPCRRCNRGKQASLARIIRKGKNVVFSGIQSKTKEYEQCLTLLFMIVDGSNLNSFGGSWMNNTSAEAEYLFWPQEEVTQ